MLLLRLKRYYKEYILKNSFLVYIKKHKFKMFIYILFILFSVFILIFSFNRLNKNIKFNKQLIGPYVNNFTLNLNDNFNLNYSGNINNSKIFGKGTLMISTDDFKIIFNGDFGKKDFKNNKEVEVGDFKNGYIKIEDNKNNKTYIWDGYFKDSYLIEGILKITDISNDKSISYEGKFEKGVLNGIGIKTIKNNNSLQKYKGMFINGIIKEQGY